MLDITKLDGFVSVGIIQSVLEKFVEDKEVFPLSKTFISIDYVWRYYLTDLLKDEIDPLSYDELTELLKYEEEFKVALLCKGPDILNSLSKEETDGDEYSKWIFLPHEQCFLRYELGNTGECS